MKVMNFIENSGMSTCSAGDAAIWMMHWSAASTAPVALVRPQLCTMSATKLCLHATESYKSTWTYLEDNMHRCREYGINTYLPADGSVHRFAHLFKGFL